MENSVYRETWGTSRGGRHFTKRSSDPRVAYTGIKVQVRDLVQIMGIVDPFASRGSVPGKIRFIEPQAINVPGAPSSGTPRENQAKFRDGTMWGM